MGDATRTSTRSSHSGSTPTNGLARIGHSSRRLDAATRTPASRTHATASLYDHRRDRSWTCTAAQSTAIRASSRASPASRFRQCLAVLVPDIGTTTTATIRTMPRSAVILARSTAGLGTIAPSSRGGPAATPARHATIADRLRLLATVSGLASAISLRSMQRSLRQSQRRRRSATICASSASPASTDPSALVTLARSGQRRPSATVRAIASPTLTPAALNPYVHSATSSLVAAGRLCTPSLIAVRADRSQPLTIAARSSPTRGRSDRPRRSASCWTVTPRVACTRRSIAGWPRAPRYATSCRLSVRSLHSSSADGADGRSPDSTPRPMMPMR